MLFLLWADDENAVLRSISAPEWLLHASTWVVGGRIPDEMEYPELNALNADHCQAAPAALAKGSGLENAVLPWTPDEYLYRVLQFNQVTLPREALLAIRFWSLRLWYQQDCYEELCTPQDAETKEWLQRITQYATAPKKMKEVDPPRLMPYYLGLAQKYLPAELHW
jgi:inositol oxygenase